MPHLPLVYANTDSASNNYSISGASVCPKSEGALARMGGEDAT